MTTPTMQLVTIGEVTLDLCDSGGPGDPVLFIHSLRDDWYGVLAEPALRDRYRAVLPHRRGYGRSSADGHPLSFSDHAADCRAVLSHLGIERAHVVGLSIGGSMALQFAKDYPDAVHTLTLVEPALLSVFAGYAQALESLGQAQSRYDAGDKSGAITVHFEELAGPDAWTDAPAGMFERAVEDADTLYQYDGPALAQWAYSAEDAARITQPILNIRGANTRPYYKEIHDTVQSWFPHAEAVVIPDAKHGVPQTQPADVADKLAEFWSRYPITPR